MKMKLLALVLGVIVLGLAQPAIAQVGGGPPSESPAAPPAPPPPNAGQGANLATGTLPAAAAGTPAAGVAALGTSGKAVVSASEPLVLLVVGIGLLGARYLRRVM